VLPAPRRWRCPSTRAPSPGRPWLLLKRESPAPTIHEKAFLSPEKSRAMSSSRYCEYFGAVARESSVGRRAGSRGPDEIDPTGARGAIKLGLPPGASRRERREAPRGTPLAPTNTGPPCGIVRTMIFATFSQGSDTVKGRCGVPRRRLVAGPGLFVYTRSGVRVVAASPRSRGADDRGRCSRPFSPRVPTAGRSSGSSSSRAPAGDRTRRDRPRLRRARPAGIPDRGAGAAGKAAAINTILAGASGGTDVTLIASADVLPFPGRRGDRRRARGPGGRMSGGQPVPQNEGRSLTDRMPG